MNLTPSNQQVLSIANLAKNLNAAQTAEVIAEVLPFIQKFRKKTIVIKFGGHAMIDDKLKEKFASDIVLLAMVGFKVVVIHGGGPQIAVELKRVNIQSKFIDGLRVTDKNVMSVVEKVLMSVNHELTHLIEKHSESLATEGIHGGESYLFFCQRVRESLGFVGRVIKVNNAPITLALNQEKIPVICPIGIGDDKQKYNINADWAACKLAISLNAEKIIFLTDTTGVLAETGELIPNLGVKQTGQLIKKGVIKGGMIPKVLCALEALKFGVNRAHIIDGRVSHAILIELLTNKGIGTVID